MTDPIHINYNSLKIDFRDNATSSCIEFITSSVVGWDVAADSANETVSTCSWNHLLHPLVSCPLTFEKCGGVMLRLTLSGFLASTWVLCLENICQTTGEVYLFFPMRLYNFLSWNWVSNQSIAYISLSMIGWNFISRKYWESMKEFLVQNIWIEVRNTYMPFINWFIFNREYCEYLNL